MPNTIAEYYKDELIDWNNSILFHNKEMQEMTQKLAEVIRRNSIEGIGEKVEAHQALLNHLSDAFYQLQLSIQEQHASLKTDSRLIDDTLVGGETERRQNDIRRRMQETVKAYVDVKFNCYNFLSGTLRKNKE
jgi:hypothetical protein